MTDPRILDLASRLADISRELDQILQTAVDAPLPVEAGQASTPAMPTKPEPSLLLNQRELAELLGVNVRTLQRMRHAGELPPTVPVGRRLRWRRGDVETWLEERTS